MQCDKMCEIKYISGSSAFCWFFKHFIVMYSLNFFIQKVFVKRLLSADDVPTFIMSLSVITDLP
jgi:hypothetical protein